MSLRYIGAEPGADSGVTNRKEVNDFILEHTRNLTPPREQAALRGAIYPARNEADQLFSQYATKTQLNQELAKYYDIQELNETLAGRAGTSLPQEQWPTDFRPYMEPQGPTVSTNIAYRVINTYATTITSITVPELRYQWSPVVFGHVEARAESGVMMTLWVQDQSGRRVAQGYSSRGKLSMIGLGGSATTPTYSGSQTFSVRASNSGGNGRANVTGWDSKIEIFPVPA